MQEIQQGQEKSESKVLYWWLLLAIFFEYARPGALVPALEAIKLNSLIPLSLFLACLIFPNTRSIREIVDDPLSKWVLIYFGLVAFSTLTAVVTFYAFDKTIQALGYTMLCFSIVRTVRSERQIFGVFKTLIAANLFLLFMNPHVVLEAGQRSRGLSGGTFLGDGNDFALSLCILIPMSIALALKAESKSVKIFWWSVLTIMLLSVVGTSSRGATVGLVAIAGYLWLISRNKMATILAFGVAVVAIFAFAPDTYFERMGTITEYEADSSAMGRIDAWKASINMSLSNPVFGIGAGNFPTEVHNYRGASSSIRGLITAHSSYFLVLGELGLPGLWALLTLVLGNIVQTGKLRKTLIRNGIGASAGDPVPDYSTFLYLVNASMIGFAVPGAFLSAAYYPHVFVLTGLMVATRCIVKNKFQLR